MIPYLLLAIFLAFACIFADITKKSLLTFIIVSFLLFALAFCRNISVGTDFINYSINFKQIGKWGNASERLEPAWYLIYKLFYELSNFRTYVFFFYVFLYYFFLKFIWKESRYPLLGLLLYLLLGHYFESYNILRQSFAAIFACYSVIYIQKRKLIEFLTLIFIGSLFHSSVILFLPMYLVIPWLKNYKYLLIGAMFVSFIIGISGISSGIFNSNSFGSNTFILEKYLILLSEEKEFLSFMGKFINILPVAIVSISLLVLKNEENKYYFALSSLGICIENILIHYQFIYRFTHPLLIIFLIIALPNVILDIESRFLKVGYISIILFYGLVTFYLILKNNSSGIIPYQPFF